MQIIFDERKMNVAENRKADKNGMLAGSRFFVFENPDYFLQMD